ncbi:hypothetical protein NLK61_13635 [Pseudomonas fuscovaginae UPB0736]|uniref:Uncharacterized protein n=1 Tax=Pseudomonas asplenii TaxID=53407 RepID=A0A1H1S347_9PSED|nr:MULTISPECIES: hypothetical protein [Pseudomonas]UUQ67624.1 hypothetical protein NLK61_13635 [Pseudomonas fuscovaginae UPB0736]UZE29111.1 hypothetical protein LOY63_28095 [Pseudomonas asplenii]SDS42374.1 hypothetical protein SAMN05216598_1547 [Pseudomonas asplenii]
MARHHEEQSSVKTRRQQEDQRRMEFRRAIEDRNELRQLQEDVAALNYWQMDSVADHRSAQPAR